jgi:hypothetical protein
MLQFLKNLLFRPQPGQGVYVVAAQDKVFVRHASGTIPMTPDLARRLGQSLLDYAHLAENIHRPDTGISEAGDATH